MFPNPTTSLLNVNMVNTPRAALDGILYNPQGVKKINIKLQNGNKRIDVNQFAKGNYILQIVEPDTTENSKNSG